MYKYSSETNTHRNIIGFVDSSCLKVSSTKTFSGAIIFFVGAFLRSNFTSVLFL